MTPWSPRLAHMGVEQSKAGVANEQPRQAGQVSRTCSTAAADASQRTIASAPATSPRERRCRQFRTASLTPGLPPPHAIHANWKGWARGWLRLREFTWPLAALRMSGHAAVQRARPRARARTIASKDELPCCILKPVRASSGNFVQTHAHRMTEAVSLCSAHTTVAISICARGSRWCTLAHARARLDGSRAAHLATGVSAYCA